MAFIPSSPRIESLENRVIVKRKRVEIVGPVTIGTTTVPFDSTIPQISEGNEVFNFDYTPKKAGNLIIVSLNILANHTAVSNGFCGIYIDGVADAIVGQFTDSVGQADRAKSYLIDYEFSVPSSPETPVLINFQVRVGSNSPGTTSINTASSTTDYGDVFRSWILIEETETPPV